MLRIEFYNGIHLANRSTGGCSILIDSGMLYLQLLRLSFEENGIECRWRGYTNWYSFSSIGEIWGNSNYKVCEIEWLLLSNTDLLKKENDSLRLS